MIFTLLFVFRCYSG